MYFFLKLLEAAKEDEVDSFPTPATYQPIKATAVQTTETPEFIFMNYILIFRASINPRNLVDKQKEYIIMSTLYKHSFISV
jgi:hypothetical protein